MHKQLATLLLSMLAATAYAQAPLGAVTSVNGVATVTTGTAGTAITVGAPIVEGARVITTSTGSVTFRLASGCVVTVPPGSAVTVRSAMSCEQLQAAIQPVSTAVTTTTATTATTGVAGTPFATPSGAAMAGFAALLAVGAIAASDDDDGDTAPISGR
jgi:hypothetical protein